MPLTVKTDGAVVAFFFFFNRTEVTTTGYWKDRTKSRKETAGCPETKLFQITSSLSSRSTVFKCSPVKTCAPPFPNSQRTTATPGRRWEVTGTVYTSADEPRPSASSRRRPAAAQRPLLGRGGSRRRPEAGTVGALASVRERCAGGAGCCSGIPGGCVGNERLRRAALLLKGELAANLFPALPCCSAGYRNKRCPRAGLPGQRSEFAWYVEEPQNLGGTDSRYERLPHSRVCGDGC